MSGSAPASTGNIAASLSFMASRQPERIGEWVAALAVAMWVCGALLLGAERIRRLVGDQVVELQLALPAWQDERPTHWRHRIGGGPWSAAGQSPLRLEVPAGLTLVDIQAVDGRGRMSALLPLRLQVAPYWHETLRARAAYPGCCACPLRPARGRWWSTATAWAAAAPGRPCGARPGRLPGWRCCMCSTPARTVPCGRTVGCAG